MRQAADYLVAHRGDRAGGVENTLAGFAAAVAAGARFAECDIQFSSDFVPLVIHDPHLKRLCGENVRIAHEPAAALQNICHPYFDLPTLAELLDWLSSAPQLTLFVEIKPPVRRRLSDRAIARRLREFFPSGLLPRLVLISQSAGLLDACAGELACPLGWVAESPKPPQAVMQYVFMPWQRLAEMPEWQARGVKVGLYTVNDSATAVILRQAGADLVESNFFARMAGEIDA